MKNALTTASRAAKGFLEPSRFGWEFRTLLDLAVLR
jgi:hypothetical protein